MEVIHVFIAEVLVSLLIAWLSRDRKTAAPKEKP
jgi:hypothetical protein